MRLVHGIIAVTLTVAAWTTPVLGQDPASDAPVLLVQPPGLSTQSSRNYPLVVALHPNGSTPEALKTLLGEHLARRGRVVVALPRAAIPVGTGFRWGSVEEAERLVVQAATNAETRVRVRRAPLVLLGFADTATLACAIALRHSVTGVIAVGPGSLTEPPDPPSVGVTRSAVLCTEGEPNAQDCQATTTLLKRLGFAVDSRRLTPERARAGMERILEALTYVTYR